MKKIISLILAIFLLTSGLTEVNTAFATSIDEIEQYGFDVAENGYIYYSWFDHAMLVNVYKENHLIGTCEMIGCMARTRSAYGSSDSYYYETVMLRQEMTPAVSKAGLTYYIGLNDKTSISYTLPSYFSGWLQNCGHIQLRGIQGAGSGCNHNGRCFFPYDKRLSFDLPENRLLYY